MILADMRPPAIKNSIRLSGSVTVADPVHSNLSQCNPLANRTRIGRHRETRTAACASADVAVAFGIAIPLGAGPCITGSGEAGD